jgi:serine/threonine-protein kinase
MSKILLIDEDVQLCRTIASWLSDLGHTTDVVHTGYEGWERLKNGGYDLALLSWDLPQINGIDILKRFRQSGGITPVIFLTAPLPMPDKETAFSCGANDFLIKPVHPRELQARIKNFMQTITDSQPQQSTVGNQGLITEANLTGTTLSSKYEFLEIIGRGGLGQVFKARHATIGKIVAIKMLFSEFATEDLVARFKREARALCRLDHPNIMTVHDFGVTESNQPYMILEYVEGSDLDAVVEQEGPLPLMPALDLSEQICNGLAHAHEMGVLHRDVKPGNVMLKRSADGRIIPKIFDFGLAKLKEPEGHSELALTQLGQVFGSPPYMSPEQIRGQVLDERSDIYSTGCLIYEILTGRVPFVADDIMDILAMHIDEEHLPMQSLRPSLPAGLDPIVKRALEKDRECRYQSMQELHDALWSVYSGLS